jgi:hypothetical protein
MNNQIERNIILSMLLVLNDLKLVQWERESKYLHYADKLYVWIQFPMFQASDEQFGGCSNP